MVCHSNSHGVHYYLMFWTNERVWSVLHLKCRLSMDLFGTWRTLSPCNDPSN
jgi:hypothetical protein